jgi:hypothetical protein
LSSLVERAERVVLDPRYLELRQFWNDFYALKEVGRVPVRVTLTMEFFARNLGIDLVDHYKKPEKYVEDSLRILLFLHKEILDDRVLEGIVVNFGEVFESSLFGSKPAYKNQADPSMGDPVIKTEKDLENMNYPDFYNSGLMPKILEVYETALKIVKDRVPVFFERWDRSPWGTAAHLMGLMDLLLNSRRNPDFVRELLAFVTESRIRWEREKEKFLGTRTERAFLYDDEVDAKLISDEMYESLVYPFEKKLADFYPKGIFYFHSCGDITPFLDTIATIPGLRRLHISPATDFKIAAQKLGGRFTFQKRLHPLKDLQLCNAKTMQQGIKEALETGKGTSMELDPGPLVNAPLGKIKTWIKEARKATSASA